MSKSNKWHLKSSTVKSSKKPFAKKRKTLIEEEVDRLFSVYIEAQVVQCIQDIMCLILEKIAVKKGLNFDDVHDEVMNLVIEVSDNEISERDIELIAEKIIRGKSVVEI